MGFLPLTDAEANLFFRFVSSMQERTSLVITSNKGFNKWAGLVEAEVISPAILDPLVSQHGIFNRSALATV